MKTLFLVLLSISLSYQGAAQGNSGTKGKDKQKDKDKPSQVSKTGDPGDKQKNDEHDRKVWDGIGDNSCMKSSKNQPAKVRAAFQRDYPNALHVRWTKCRGDWTATFNGVFFRSTAVYHANGDRRDTRTPVPQDKLPRRVLDEILNRFPGTRVDGAIKIEVPHLVKEIFRIKNVMDNQIRYDFFDSDGLPVTYDY